MLILQSRGRLGNNIFQYAFATTIAKKGEKIIFTGMKDFIHVFQKVEPASFFFTAENKFTRGVVKKLIDRVLCFFVKIGCISFYGDSDGSNDYSYRKGLITKITYISGYFHTPSLFGNESISSLLLKKEHIDKAQNILQKEDIGQKVFVHVRRGDFVANNGSDGFLVHGRSAALPLSYYKKSIQKCLYQNKNTTFVFVSDDPEYIEENFSDINNKIITSESMEVDFAIAALCDGGILSASTFSFWAAMLAISTYGAELPFYAPTYWLGHASHIWYPSTMESTHLSYVDV